MTIFSASERAERRDPSRAERGRRLNGEVVADAVLSGPRGVQRENKMQNRDVLRNAVKYFFGKRENKFAHADDGLVRFHSAR